MPEQPSVMTQTWNDLLFAHWPVDVETLRRKVPSPFEIDCFEGQAWIAIVPFHMTNVGVRAVPALPWVSAFPELNVRTYVRVGNRPGVYFFSLDAASTFAVRTARTLLNLPYFMATMKVDLQGEEVSYESSRTESPSGVFTATYRPVAPVFEPTAGTLEYFLTERYCLYNIDRLGRPYRLEIHHPPWSLQRAEATIVRNSMATANGFDLPSRAPLLHFTKRQDMVGWAPMKLL